LSGHDTPARLCDGRHTRGRFGDAATEGQALMRFIFGIIIGIAITVAGAYLFDVYSGQHMVNWDVVAKEMNTLVGLARDGWKKITG
jgi:hypothetical protein